MNKILIDTLQDSLKQQYIAIENMCTDISHPKHHSPLDAMVLCSCCGNSFCLEHSIPVNILRPLSPQKDRFFCHKCIAIEFARLERLYSDLEDNFYALQAELDYALFAEK